MRAQTTDEVAPAETSTVRPGRQNDGRDLDMVSQLALAWTLAAGFAAGVWGPMGGLVIASLGTASVVVISLRAGARRRRRAASSQGQCGNAAVLQATGRGPGSSITSPLSSVGDRDDSPFAESGEFELPRPDNDSLVSRSMLIDRPVPESSEADGGDSTEMTNRLDPRTLRWLESSRAEQSFLGWAIDRLREKTFLDVIDTEDRELARSQLASAIAKGEAHNLLYRMRTASGDLKAVEIHASVRYHLDGRPNHVRMHLTDMTKKIRADRELRRRTKELTDTNNQLRRTNRELEEVKNRYRDLYHNAPAMYFTLDGQGTIVECNQTLLKTLGRGPSSVVGASFLRLAVEERQDRFARWFEELTEAGQLDVEGRWLTSEGREIDVWLAAAAVETGPGGGPRQYRCVARDVTQRRALEAELSDKNLRLARVNADLSRKNKELDDFTYIIAHDLKEPLRTLIAFSEFLEQDCGDRLDESGRGHLRQIVDASRRMRALIRDLQELSLAGRVTGDLGPVDLVEVIDHVRNDLEGLLRTRGGLIRIEGGLPRVWGDEVRLIQLFANLIGNGMKYNRSEAPTVTIRSSAPAGSIASPDCATLAVSDNGIGIDPRFYEKIFKLFGRLHTREEYEGTGAGLAICQKIARAHGGKIWVESDGISGSTFYVNLPTTGGRTTASGAPGHAD